MKVPYDDSWNTMTAEHSPHSDEVRTKSAGYMTVEQQVRAMQAAGQNLAMQRATMYNSAQELEDPDFYNGIPEDYQHLMSNLQATAIRDIVHTWRVNELAAMQRLNTQLTQTKRDKDQPLTEDPAIAQQVAKLQAELEELKTRSTQPVSLAQAVSQESTTMTK